MNELYAVTGAFGYSGQYIARRLLAAGQNVITLTNSPNRPNPFGEAVQAHPFNFDQPEKLVETLRGVTVLYNTYWVRFNHPNFSQTAAVDNSLTLFKAARAAGVRRVVHISITNPDITSPLAYFSGKARLEQALIESELSYAILRPAILFGKEDVLLNNIAWALRKLPVFGVFGNGKYRLRPIYVDDLAQLAVEQGQSDANVIINATGPETFTYHGLVRTIGAAIGKRRLVLPVPPSIGYVVSKVIGRLNGDVLLTRDEIKGLMTNLLYVNAPPVGHTRLSDWAWEHADTLGQQSVSGLAQRQ